MNISKNDAIEKIEKLEAENKALKDKNNKEVTELRECNKNLKAELEKTRVGYRDRQDSLNRENGYLREELLDTKSENRKLMSIAYNLAIRISKGKERERC